MNIVAKNIYKNVRRKKEGFYDYFYVQSQIDKDILITSFAVH